MAFFARQIDWINTLFTPSKTTNTAPVAVSDDVQLVQQFAQFYNVSNKASQIHVLFSALNIGVGSTSGLGPAFRAEAGEFLVVQNFVIQISSQNAAFDGDTYSIFRRTHGGNPGFTNTTIMWLEFNANPNWPVALFAYGGTQKWDQPASSGSSGAQFLIPAGGELAWQHLAGSVGGSYTMLAVADVWRVPIGTSL